MVHFCRFQDSSCIKGHCDRPPREAHQKLLHDAKCKEPTLDEFFAFQFLSRMLYEMDLDFYLGDCLSRMDTCWKKLKLRDTDTLFAVKQKNLANVNADDFLLLLMRV